MTDFKSGDAVQVNRPKKQHHGRIGRYLPAPDPAFGYVAFNKQETDKLPPIDALHKQDKYPRILFPLSQLVRHEPKQA